MIRVQAKTEFVSPKFCGHLAIWPDSELALIVLWVLSIVWQLLPDNDWWALCIPPVFLCKLNPMKAHWGIGSWPFSLARWATFLPQADRVLADLFSSMPTTRHMAHLGPRNRVWGWRQGEREAYKEESTDLGFCFYWGQGWGPSAWIYFLLVDLKLRSRNLNHSRKKRKKTKEISEGREALSPYSRSVDGSVFWR